MDVVASETHRLHDTVELSRGRLVPSSESPRRAAIITSALSERGHSFHRPEAIDIDLVRRVHAPDYVEFLSTAWDRWADRYGPDAAAAMGFMWPSRANVTVRPTDLVGQLGYHSFAADTAIAAGTWTAAVESAAIAQTATDRVVDGTGPAYALCRPPGHHATTDQFGGYCYLNNAAITAQRFRDRGAVRVAVLDIDYHHGNGTQAIFYGRSDVLTVSIHADPTEEFPWFVGHADEHGIGDGLGWNVNTPLPRGADASTWHAALRGSIERIDGSGATALVVALGVDTYRHDPLGTFQLDTDAYRRAAQSIASLGLPMVVVQEGGYAVDDIGTNVATFLEALS